MSQPSLKKNFIYRLLYEILAVITPLITTPYLARILEPDGNGTFSYLASLMSTFTMFAALGTVGYGTREIAQHRDDPKESSKIFWEIELLVVITSFTCLIVWILFSFIYKEYTPFLLALTPMLLGTMLDISWYFTGYEKILYTVLKNSLVKILGIILLFLLIKRKDDLLVYILMHSLVNLLGSISMWTYLPKMLVKINMRSLEIKKHFKETIIYFIPTIATSVYTILDKTLIGVITQNRSQNGYYEEATKIVNIIKTLVFSSVNAVMGARMSYLFAYDKYDEIKQRIRRSLDFIFLLGFGCVFGLIGVARIFIPIFLGPGYDESIILLYLMSPLIIIIGISNCLGSQYFTPSGQRARSAKVIVFGAVVNLLMNIILIPVYESRGAVIASLLAELLIAVLYVYMSNCFVTIKDIVACSWRRIIAGTIMYIIVICIGRIGAAASIQLLLSQIIVGILVYFTVLLGLGDSMLKWILEQVIKMGRRVLEKYRK